MPTSIDQSKALFIRQWSAMSSYWGISRTMAEIHALMYISARPLCTDDVMEQLQVSRGNASMNLRQLLDWGLLCRVHRKGDRKEYFSAETDVWEIFETITRERRRRELQPVVDTISQCQEMIEDCSDGQEPEEVQVYRSRLTSMHDFLGTMHGLLNIVLKVKSTGIRKFTHSLGKLVG